MDQLNTWTMIFLFIMKHTQIMAQLMWHHLCKASCWGTSETINATIKTRMTNTPNIGYGTWYVIWITTKRCTASLDDQGFFFSSSYKNFLKVGLSSFLCLQDVSHSISQVLLKHSQLLMDHDRHLLHLKQCLYLLEHLKNYFSNKQINDHLPQLWWDMT